MGISQFYSGAVPMDAPGVKRLVQMQLVVGISLFYSGAVQTDALGIETIAKS
jgi:hypothetical protein